MKLRAFEGLPREVAVLAAVAFAVAVGFGVVVPALPLFAREFGVGNTAAGAVISAFAFMRLVSALASGRLVDRFGERVILAAGIGIVAVSSAVAGLAQSYNQLVVLRGVGGIGSAMFTVSAMSLLLRVAGPEQRGRATGLWQSGFLFGAIAGPALGGPGGRGTGLFLACSEGVHPAANPVGDLIDDLTDIIGLGHGLGVPQVRPPREALGRGACPSGGCLPGAGRR